MARNTVKRMKAVQLIRAIPNEIGKYYELLDDKTYEHETSQSIYDELNRLGYFWQNENWIFSEALLKSDETTLNVSTTIGKDLSEWINKQSKKLGFNRSETIVFLLEEFRRNEDEITTDEKGQLRHKLIEVRRRIYGAIHEMNLLVDDLKRGK